MNIMSIRRESMVTPIVALMLILLLLPQSVPVSGTFILPKDYSDVDILEFFLNLEFVEAEFFLFAALGYGLDGVAPELTKGGPPPINGTKANLDNFTADIIMQFGYQEAGNVRAILEIVKGFPRPQLNLSSTLFTTAIDLAFGRKIIPPFNPYSNSLNFLIASYIIPYVGLTGYVGANPNLTGDKFKKIVAGLLGVKAGQDAVIRALLYERREMKVAPYDITVAEFTNRLSELRNTVGGAGLKDEGLVVPMAFGAEGRVSGNVLSADQNSLSYARAPVEILRIVNGGSERVPGGFFPKGASGRIARSFLVPA